MLNNVVGLHFNAKYNMLFTKDSKLTYSGTTSGSTTPTFYSAEGMNMIPISVGIVFYPSNNK